MSNAPLDAAVLTRVQDIRPGQVVEHHKRYWPGPRRVTNVAPQQLFTGAHTVLYLARDDKPDERMVVRNGIPFYVYPAATQDGSAN